MKPANSKEIKYGFCNHGVYRKSIELLTEITGVKWGYVKPSRKISYISSEITQYKFGITRQKVKQRFDYEIVNINMRVENWELLLAHELKSAILHLLQTRPQVAVITQNTQNKSTPAHTSNIAAIITRAREYIVKEILDSDIDRSNIDRGNIDRSDICRSNIDMKTCVVVNKYLNTSEGRFISGMFEYESNFAAEELKQYGQYMPKVFTLEELT